MADMMSGFSGFTKIAQTGKYIGIFFLLLIVMACILGMFFMFLAMSRQTKVIEINENKRLKIFNGRYKKKKGTSIKQFWAQKIGYFLPQFRENEIYTKGNQDTVILFKDNNSLHHNLKVPSYKEIKKWYKVVYDIDLENPKEKEKHKALKDIYFLPSPHANLDWLSSQIVEAEEEYKSQDWWKHPNVLFGMSIAGNLFLWMLSFVFIYLTNK